MATCRGRSGIKVRGLRDLRSATSCVPAAAPPSPRDGRRRPAPPGPAEAGVGCADRHDRGQGEQLHWIRSGKPGRFRCCGGSRRRKRRGTPLVSQHPRPAEAGRPVTIAGDHCRPVRPDALSLTTRGWLLTCAFDLETLRPFAELPVGHLAVLPLGPAFFCLVAVVAAPLSPAAGITGVRTVLGNPRLPGLLSGARTEVLAPPSCPGRAVGLAACAAPPAP